MPQIIKNGILNPQLRSMIVAYEFRRFSLAKYLVVLRITSQQLLQQTRQVA